MVGFVEHHIYPINNEEKGQRDLRRLLLGKMVGFVEHHLYPINNEVGKGLSLDAQVQKLASQHWIEAIVPEGDLMGATDPELTVQRMSSYAISASIFLWIFLIYSQTLLAKYLATKARVSIFIAVDMLGLLSFMVLAWAVGVKILVGGKLSRMNCSMFLLWAILKLFKSDNSIDAVYLPILGIFFIGWHAMSSLDTKYQNC
ncbi:uncharacterized protein LOC107486075 isoform X2 [Arachis duranensis]|nr:uncharacterized protein LOC107486075 isoform X2 [Arachis duranensis]